MKYILMTVLAFVGYAWVIDIDAYVVDRFFGYGCHECKHTKGSMFSM